MPKWEYLNVYWMSTESKYFINDQEAKDWKKRPRHELFNALGQEGWELVGIGGEYANTFIFKRPKP